MFRSSRIYTKAYKVTYKDIAGGYERSYVRGGEIVKKTSEVSGNNEIVTRKVGEDPTGRKTTHLQTGHRTNESSKYHHWYEEWGYDPAKELPNKKVKEPF